MVSSSLETAISLSTSPRHSLKRAKASGGSLASVAETRHTSSTLSNLSRSSDPISRGRQKRDGVVGSIKRSTTSTWPSVQLRQARSLELMQGGIVTDLLLREYLLHGTCRRRRQQNEETEEGEEEHQQEQEEMTDVLADELYRWQRQKQRQRRKILNMFATGRHFNSEEDSSDDEESADENTNNPYSLACLDRLAYVLGRDIRQFWRQIDLGSQHKQHSKDTCNMDGARFCRSSQLFRRKVGLICRGMREATCLEIEVDHKLNFSKLHDEVFGFLQKEDQSMRREVQGRFWELYHMDNAVLQHSVKQQPLAAVNGEKPTLAMSQTCSSLFKTASSIGSSGGKKRSRNSVKLAEAELLARRSSEQRPPWIPTNPDRVRPLSRCSRPSTQGDSRAATPLTKSGALAQLLKRPSAQSMAPELQRASHIYGIPKMLPNVILESPPPPKPTDVDPFRSMRTSLSSFNLTSMDRHARRSRRIWMQKVGMEQRNASAVLPTISSSLHTYAAKNDANCALKEMRQCASEVALRGGLHAEIDPANIYSSNKLPPVLDLAGCQPTANRNDICGSIGNTTSGLDQPAAQYIEACHSSKVVPRPAVLAMSRIFKIEAGSGDMLTNEDLATMQAMIKQLKVLRSVVLSGNSLLNDRALVLFLQELFGDPAERSLAHLSLRDCRGCGRSAVHTTISLVSRGLVKLQQLDLSGVKIPITSCLPLCDAIRTHPSLRSVHLADTGLGYAPMGQACVTNLLVAPRIEVLDLGWNCFPEGTFRALGEAVVSHRALKKLSLANCTGCRNAMGETPVAAFIECLSRDRKLQCLDLSSNQIDFRGALVLESALQFHGKITELRIGQNPLGLEGMRCFLRLLSRKTCGLVNYDCSNCEGPQDSDEPKFNPCNPAGPYELDLSNTYDRSVLRMLYSVCEHLQIDVEKCFTKTSFEPTRGVQEHLEHPKARDSSGSWFVPYVGCLETMFVIDSVFLKADGKLQTRKHGVELWGIASPMQNEDIAAVTITQSQQPQPLAAHFLQQYQSLARSYPAFRKMVPFLAHFRRIKGKEHEQKLFLEALSCDFCLSFAHIQELCKHSGSIAPVISTLLHTLVGGPSQQCMALALLLKDLDSYVVVRTSCHELLALNVEHPTGHYELDLASPSKYAVAETLRLIDRWEATMAQRMGCEDLSMHGNWSSVRNCVYHRVHINSLAEWRLPRYDKVRFDFVTWRRAPPDAHTMDEGSWNNLLITLATSSARVVDKIAVLRRISGSIWVKAMQVRDVIGLFANASSRVEVIITFALRLADPQNMKLLRACIADHLEWRHCTRRVGTLVLFPHYQPEEYNFELDLEVYEDRMATVIAVQLAARERLENIRRPTWVLPDGSEKGLEYGISKTWQNIGSVPQSGRLKFQYLCGPTDRDFALRKELSMKYGGWRTNVLGSEQVMWWKSLSDAPDSLLSFLFHCMAHHNNAYEVFRVVNGSGSGRISRPEFERSIDEMGLKQFKDPDLARQLFRFLDMDGGGDVCPAEWDALQELWNELELSILEFLMFLDRTFGGNFDMAWEELEAEGLHDYEWKEAVQAIGYFGHCTPIFNFVAKGEGRRAVMTRRGWEKLSAKWSKRKEILNKILTGEGRYSERQVSASS